MTPLASPILLGDVSPRRWYDFLSGSRWKRYFASLKAQLAERGPIPDGVWHDSQRLEVASTIEAILGEICWGECLRFHPDDQWLIVGEWEIGDLSEVEAWMKIEERYGIKFEEHESKALIAHGTFADVVDAVIAKTRAGANPPTSPIPHPFLWLFAAALVVAVLFVSPHPAVLIGVLAVAWAAIGVTVGKRRQGRKSVMKAYWWIGILWLVCAVLILLVEFVG